MKRLRGQGVILKLISAILIVLLHVPYAWIFAGEANDKIVFLGVLDKEDTWLNVERLKWMKISFLSSKYEWESNDATMPLNIEKIAEESKLENVRKIIYGKIQETETAKKKNGIAIAASFYVYDAASKNTREIALTGISPQKPGYGGSEELLYDEALKDLSAQLVAVIDETGTLTERGERKLASKKHKKKFLGIRMGYFEDDTVFGSHLLDMIMGAGLLYMVFFHRTGSSSNSGTSTSTLSCPPPVPTEVEAPPWCYLTSSQSKVFHPITNNDGTSNGNCKSNSLFFSSQKEACNAGYRPSETDFDLSGLYNQWSACGIIKSDNTVDTSQCSQFQ